MFLMKEFRRAIARQFQKIKAYFVGPEAAALLHDGGRLTISTQSPKSVDLSPA